LRNITPLFTTILSTTEFQNFIGVRDLGVYGLKRKKITLRQNKLAVFKDYAILKAFKL